MPQVALNAAWNTDPICEHATYLPTYGHVWFRYNTCVLERLQELEERWRKKHKLADGQRVFQLSGG